MNKVKTFRTQGRYVISYAFSLMKSPDRSLRPSGRVLDLRLKENSFI